MTRHVAPSSFENDRREHMAQSYPEWQQQINPPRHWTGTYSDAPHTQPSPPVDVLIAGLVAARREGQVLR